ncbi:MAG: TIGR01777 family oxidoreductase [Microscillaceae bacterium]|jgi:hypothetical protein|nr:TIGR01777 family oxidoreductase [Microscillaceae bacterium]
MQKRVLITGGTGLVGKRLSQMLLNLGYQVSFLSRQSVHIPSVEVYQWNIREGFIEEKALQNADYIIHLAGAGVAEQTWTEDRKREILHSRTHSTELLAKYLKNLPHSIKGFVSASAIGWYGLDKGDIWLDENAPATGKDFLSEVTRQWEKSIDSVAELGLRTVKLRIGVVLSAEGGALPKIAQPIRWGAGAALGSGNQYMSWIHEADLCRMFIYMLENEQLSGAFNAVGKNPLTNAEFTRAVAKQLQKPLFLPNVPSFVLKMMLGEMSDIVLGGARVSCQKIEQAGFQFQYPSLSAALASLL